MLTPRSLLNWLLPPGMLRSAFSYAITSPSSGAGRAPRCGSIRHRPVRCRRTRYARPRRPLYRTTRIRRRRRRGSAARSGTPCRPPRSSRVTPLGVVVVVPPVQFAVSLAGLLAPDVLAPHGIGLPRLPKLPGRLVGRILGQGALGEHA